MGKTDFSSRECKHFSHLRYETSQPLNMNGHKDFLVRGWTVAPRRLNWKLNEWFSLRPLGIVQIALLSFNLVF